MLHIYICFTKHYKAMKNKKKKIKHLQQFNLDDHIHKMYMAVADYLTDIQAKETSTKSNPPGIHPSKI